MEFATGGGEGGRGGDGEEGGLVGTRYPELEVLTRGGVGYGEIGGVGDVDGDVKEGGVGGCGGDEGEGRLGPRVRVLLNGGCEAGESAAAEGGGEAEAEAREGRHVAVARDERVSVEAFRVRYKERREGVGRRGRLLILFLFYFFKYHFQTHRM